MTDKLILASGSPRRLSLLTNYGFDVTVIKPDFDESDVTERDPEKLVALLAREKNRCVRGFDIPVLSADTVVATDSEILGKPTDEEDAFNMLSTLSDNTHTVYTGVCIYADNKEITFVEKSRVTFYPLTEKQIRAYIATGSPMDKAGSYGVQDDMGIAFVKEVQGELSNVIGLPMGSVISHLKEIQGENNGL